MQDSLQSTWTYPGLDEVVVCTYPMVPDWGEYDPDPYVQRPAGRR